MPSVIRMLVVEDFNPFRRLLTSMIGEQQELQITCEVSDVLEAVRKAAELQPYLVLLDIGLPGLNGIKVARRIRDLAPQSRIVFVSQKSPPCRPSGIRIGGIGYVVKLDADGHLLYAISSVLRDRKVVSNRGCRDYRTGPTDRSESGLSAHRRFASAGSPCGYAPSSPSLFRLRISFQPSTREKGSRIENRIDV